MGSKKYIILFSLVCFFFLEISAQVGIGTTSPNASSSLDIQSTNSGVLIPRIALTSSTDVVTILAPEVSLLIFNTSTVADDVFPGYYFWNGSRWTRINDNSDKVYGEIYNSSTELSYTSMQQLNTTRPIRFEIPGEIKGVTPIPLSGTPITPAYQGFEISRSGLYRVSYSISVEMYKHIDSTTVPPEAIPTPVRVGFYLTTRNNLTTPINNTDLLANRILGSFSRSRVTFLGHTSCSMSKIVHLDAGDRVRLYSDRSFAIVYVIRDTATMNIELIEPD